MRSCCFEDRKLDETMWLDMAFVEALDAAGLDATAAEIRLRAAVDPHERERIVPVFLGQLDHQRVLRELVGSAGVHD